MSADEEKKRPGRPRKKQAGFVIPYTGIITSEHEESILDIIYENPIMFKKIFTIFKTHNVESIHVKFEPTMTKMYAQDPIKKNQIYIEVLGDKMNRHYCKYTIDVIINSDVYKRILSSITKECIFIGFNMTTMHRLILITKIPEHDMETHSHLDVQENLEYNWNIEDFIKDINTYNLNFELSAKIFRTKITNLKSCADVLIIEKNGHKPLKFNAVYNDKHGEDNTFFLTDDKIKLYSNLSENDLFGTSVYLEHIKSVASTNIADNIIIYVDKVRDIVFKFILDMDEQPIEGKRNKVNESERARVYITTEIIKPM